MKLMKLKGWKFYTNGKAVGAKHKCGTEFAVLNEEMYGLFLEDIIAHVC